MLLKRFLPIISLLFFVSYCFSQQNRNTDNFKKDSLQFQKFFKIAENWFYQNNIDKSVEFLEKASAIAYNIELYDYWVECELYKASFISYNGDFNATFKILDSLEVLTETIPMSDDAKSNIFNYKSIFLKEEDDIQTAISYDEKSFALKEKNGASPADKDFYYTSLGISYMKLGKYEQAVSYYQLALKEQDKALNDSLITVDRFYFRRAIVNNNLSETYLLNENIIKAIEYAERAEEKMGQLKQVELALSQRNAQVLAEAYMADGNVEQAKLNFYKRLDIIEKDSRKNIRERIEAILAIANFEKKYGDTGKSGQMYDHVEVYLDSLKTNPKALYFAISPVVKNYFDNGDLKNAKKFLDRGLGKVTIQDVEESFLDYSRDIGMYAELLSLMGLYHYKQYQKEGNTEFLKKSIAWYRVTYGFLGTMSQKLGDNINPKFIEILDEINKHALATFYIATDTFNEKEIYYSDVLSIIEFEKSFSRNINIKKAQADVLVGLPKSLYSLEKAQKKKIRRLLLQFQKDELNDTLNKNLNKQIDILDSIRKDITEKYPEYDKLKRFDYHFDYTELVKKVKKNQTSVLSFYYNDKYLYRFLVTPQRTVFDRLTLKDSFESDIAKYINAIKDYKTNDYRIKGQTLFEQIFKNIESSITNTELVVVPYGVLNVLPFETLPTKDGFLFEKTPISYEFSLVKWITPKVDVSKNRKNILLFTPVFPKAKKEKDNNRRTFTELTHSLNEANYIDEIFNTVRFDFNKATKQNFIQNKDHNILHLATHVRLNEESPMETKIFFAPNPDQKNNDALNIYEILDMQLPSKMVVLSACDTGIGPIKKGDGVQSLASSFSYAGADSVVMSLWQVDDNSTSILMKYFYKSLKEGQSKNKALQNAKLKYLANTEDELLKHPYYWAGFIVSGDTSPLVQNLYWPWVLGIAGLILLLIVFRKKLIKLG
ncbi:CHAT domain-containing protein [Flavobacteriaceae bacterium R38]|nr:CHAT domain-containing protein [Flavobacteriaceae bacterium R38]